jgi:hypothetical protein
MHGGTDWVKSIICKKYLYVRSDMLIYRFPIVEPDSGHTKLRLSREGLEAIQRIKTPIAAISVCHDQIL